MLLTNKILFSDNGVVSDLSPKLNDIHTGTETIAVVAAQDAIYLGSQLPFNHKQFEVSTVNALPSVVSVSLWNGKEFKAVAQVLDETSITGATLAQSGRIVWVPDQDEPWVAEDTEDVTGLTSFKIYGMYWAKLTFSADLTGTTAINYVGQKFSDDNVLTTMYPELGLSNLKVAFEAGKADWNEQHLFAAQQLQQDIKAFNWVDYLTHNQILDWEQFKFASAHLVASMVFRAFGDDYKDNFEQAMKDYNESLKKNFTYDNNRNARIDIRESVTDFRVFRR